jgi:hypothetical protein
MNESINQTKKINNSLEIYSFYVPFWLKFLFFQNWKGSCCVDEGEKKKFNFYLNF